MELITYPTLELRNLDSDARRRLVSLCLVCTSLFLDDLAKKVRQQLLAILLQRNILPECLGGKLKTLSLSQHDMTTYSL